jgi:methylenetetrahydrofolate reductase (NADPH)
MPIEKTAFERRIESDEPLLLAEIDPPASTDPAPLRETAQRLSGKVHALGVTDNRDRVSMSALAAACVVAGAGVEPILHVVTRDRNRIALVSDCLGAAALGIRNLLCTSGTHQTLGPYRAARNVFDLDCVQLLQTYAELGSDGAVVGAPRFEVSGSLCLGGTAAPYADPLELQVLRMAKKAHAGAKFFVTQPVFDVERFEAWWTEVTRRGLPKETAIVAGIRPLTSAEEAQHFAAGRPSPRVPRALVDRIAAESSPAEQRKAGIEIALETIQRLRKVAGLRGFQVCVNGDLDAAVEVVERARS